MNTKFKKGDKVVILPTVEGHIYANWRGGMNHWIGKTMTIREPHSMTSFGMSYFMEEDSEEQNGKGWSWLAEFFEPVQEGVE